MVTLTNNNSPLNTNISHYHSLKGESFIHIFMLCLPITGMVLQIIGQRKITHNVKLLQRDFTIIKKRAEEIKNENNELIQQNTTLDDECHAINDAEGRYALKLKECVRQLEECKVQINRGEVVEIPILADKTRNIRSQLNYHGDILDDAVAAQESLTEKILENLEMTEEFNSKIKEKDLETSRAQVRYSQYDKASLMIMIIPLISGVAIIIFQSLAVFNGTLLVLGLTCSAAFCATIRFYRKLS